MDISAPAGFAQEVRIGALIDMLGDPRLPVELARFAHDWFSADHIHISRVGRYQRDMILSASHDGSDAALRQTRIFLERKLQRFENPLMINSNHKPAELIVAEDHTQRFASPEFRSYGKELGLGARFLIRKSDPHGAVTIALLWSIQHGDITHYAADIRLAADILAPLVSKHMAFFEDRMGLGERLACTETIEADLRIALGETRRREAQVGSRLINGQTANDIAEDLHISKETVITHRKKLYDHLGIRCSRDLLVWYLSR